MKNILSLLTAGVILMSACAQQKKTTSKAETGSQIQELAMERTACFGQCPAYRVEIKKDGSVKYTGRHFTEYTGTYEIKTDPKKVAELFKSFDKYRVDTCQKSYDNKIPDLPGLIYQITYSGNKQQEIMNAHFGPDFLKQLGKEVDEFAKVDDTWTKTADAKD